MFLRENLVVTSIVKVYNYRARFLDEGGTSFL